MWGLDRFSANSTPSVTPPPHGRPYSPAPRRSYVQQPSRPGLSPRSSSLVSLASDQSSTSLPSTARPPHGSGLKHEIRNQTPVNVRDPLQVLQEIIGKPLREDRSSHAGKTGRQAVERPEEFTEEVDFGGLSLAAFASQDESRQQRLSSVHSYSEQSVDEYDRESAKFEDLHKSITACDEVLKSVQTYLTGFQTDLGNVSAEIETLQNRSTALSTKLENRKFVEKILGPAVEQISIPPAVVRKISEGPIDDGWIRALAELQNWTKAVKVKSKDGAKVKAMGDLKPLAENLTNKAVERIRDYIVTQIKALRSPSINAQIIQTQSFLKFKDLYAFLTRHQPQLAEEISKAYVNTMRWYYINHFTRYNQSLSKLRLHAVDKHDAIGNLEDSSKSRGSKLTVPPHDTFSLGRRFDLLRNPTHGALSSYVAEEDKSYHYLETPFRAFNLALVDNASFEYTFISTFFSPSHSYHALSRIFASIFEPTFALGQTLTKQLIETSVDALGILLCVRLNQHSAFELQRRKIPAVEGYVNATNMLLWPRFQLVMDMHCESLRKATTALAGRPAASLLTSNTTQSTAPHPLTQRFANFLHGILTLSSEAGDDEPVSNSLGRLRVEFEAYLAKQGKAFGDQRKRERFLFNNYSLVGTILEGVQGRLGEELTGHFVERKEAFAVEG